ncbi:class D sortase [Neobacillus sp. FSL H8-0543]|uniref:class D sortase n=1 Tax=Neobacillus sp. FSL H8-0543 TaxID=2954672 RepID=UPI0031597192
MVKKIPLIIILAGLLIIGVAAWQMINVKVQTNTALKEAKEIVAMGNQEDSSSESPTSTEKKPPKFGDTVGLLTIPRLKSELPIVEGTDPNDLNKGVGHYAGSYFPGENGQIVLSGHRDTVFRRLGELEKGDTFEMQLANGSFTYEISHTKIVESDDTSIITLQNEEEELIVTTCYPFNVIGDSPQRYIIYAKPI